MTNTTLTSQPTTFGQITDRLLDLSQHDKKLLKISLVNSFPTMHATLVHNYYGETV